MVSISQNCRRNASSAACGSSYASLVHNKPTPAIDENKNHIVARYQALLLLVGAGKPLCLAMAILRVDRPTAPGNNIVLFGVWAWSLKTLTSTPDTGWH